MPIHDWSRKPPGLFHHFHQQWAGSICNALNAGRLPEGFYAHLEQQAAGVEPDILTLEREQKAGRSHQPKGVIAVADAPPRTRFVTQASEEDIYAAMPDMPVFLDSATYILVPLEASYVATWETCPEPLRELVTR